MKRLSPLPLQLLLLGTLVVVVPACGKRGPPLPPLRPAPDRVTDLSVVRREDEVTLRFSTPIRNEDGSEPVLFDRVEIYALTVPAGGLSPDPGKVVADRNLIAQLGKLPPKAPVPVSATPDAAADEPPVARPLTFVEKVATVISAPRLQVSAPDPATVAAGVTQTTVVGLPTTTRFYMIVPYANRKRVGVRSELLSVPIGPVPLPPQNLTLVYDETTLTLSWETGGEGQQFRVYAATPPVSNTAPALNPTALTVKTFAQPVVFGQRACFVVRGVRAAPTGPISLESAPSNTQCATPVDTFPPPAPSGLAAFAGTGAITLTWDAVTAPDLAGYIVLRGEGTGDRLQPLMTAPVTGTSFADTTTRAGVRYVYAVVAVDGATPANRSKESNRVEETGR